MSGGGGRDKLFGQKGKDILSGDKGNDRLSGGNGADEFHFARRDGNDKIVDFELSKDIIMILNGASRFKALDIEQVGEDAVVSFASTSITLMDVDAADLSRAVFDFA